MQISLNLLVLRSKNIQNVKDFYSKLGFSFCEEKHGKGPLHFSSTTIKNLLLEIYPCKAEEPVSNNRLGFDFTCTVENKASNIALFEKLATQKKVLQDKKIHYILEDPDHRKIDLILHL